MFRFSTLKYQYPTWRRIYSGFWVKWCCDMTKIEVIIKILKLQKNGLVTFFTTCLLEGDSVT